MSRVTPFGTTVPACPKCGGDLEPVIHRYDTDGGAPDCSWLICLDCNYATDPE